MVAACFGLVEIASANPIPARHFSAPVVPGSLVGFLRNPTNSLANDRVRLKKYFLSDSVRVIVARTFQLVRPKYLSAFFLLTMS